MEKILGRMVTWQLSANYWCYSQILKRSQLLRHQKTCLCLSLTLASRFFFFFFFLTNNKDLLTETQHQTPTTHYNWNFGNPNFKLNELNLEWKEVGELPENKKCQCKTAKHKIKEFWKLERDSNNSEWIWKREQVPAAIEGEALEGGCETLCIWSALP